MYLFEDYLFSPYLFNNIEILHKYMTTFEMNQTSNQLNSTVSNSFN